MEELRRGGSPTIKNGFLAGEEMALDHVLPVALVPELRSAFFNLEAVTAKENLRKHGVDFADAVVALEDENALTIEDSDHDELRFKTLGMGPALNILFVVHCELVEGRVQIISARKADKEESKVYFQGLSHE